MFFLHHYRHNFGWHHHKYLGGLRQAQGAFDMLRERLTSSGLIKTREQSIKKAPAPSTNSGNRCFYKNLCVATVYFTGGFAA